MTISDLIKPAFWVFDPSAVETYWQENFWRDCVACIPSWENAVGQAPQILRGKRQDIATTATKVGTATWTNNADGSAVFFPASGDDWQIPAIASADVVSLTGITYLIVRRKTTTSIANASNFGVNTGTNRAGGHMPYLDGVVYWDLGATSAPNRLTWGSYVPSTAIEIWAFVAGTKGSAIYFNGIQKAVQTTAISRSAHDNAAIGLNLGNFVFTSDPQENLFFAVLDAEWTAAQVLEWANDPFAPIRSEYDSSSAGGGPVTQNITLTGIASTLGIGTMSLGMNIQLTGLPSTAHIGTMQLGMNIQLAGIANVNHFGTAALGMNIQLSGLPSTAAVGVPSLIPVVTLNIQLTGIKSTLGIGVPGVRDPEAASLFGISSTISFGSMKITQDAVPTNSLIDTNIPYEWVDTSENFQLYLYLLSVMNTLRTKDEAIVFVTGNPNGVVAAKPGTIALNKGGGAGNTLWTKETGLGNTGWVNVA